MSLLRPRETYTWTRYLPGDPTGPPDDYVLGWTEVDATAERVPDEDGEQASRAR